MGLKFQEKQTGSRSRLLQCIFIDSYAPLKAHTLTTFLFRPTGMQSGKTVSPPVEK